jgi:hypothetical protein
MTTGQTPATCATCANCGAVLGGEYCSACGQRVLHHGLTLREFLGEAAEVITHADSRFWRTLGLLLCRPGYLTQQFIAGRRARYLPPFRLYLVLSVVFFLAIPLTTTLQTAPTEIAGVAKVRAGTPAALREELQKEIDAATDPEDKVALQEQMRQVEAMRAKLAPIMKGDTVDCTAVGKLGVIPRALQERAVTACDRVHVDNGLELGLSLVHNLGRAMFVLLPLFAALMKLMYHRPPRLYVEHLLLLLHNHAFLFLAMSVLMILTRFIVSDSWAGWVGTGISAYMVYYVFASMRRVYGQGWIRTFLKFAVLACAYVSFAALMFVVTAIVSAATL